MQMNQIEVPFEIPKNVEDVPEFWLGQVGAIVNLQRKKLITKTQAVNSIRDVMQSAYGYQQYRFRQAMAIADAIGKESNGEETSNH